jgi:hypothetical protein
MQIGLSLMMNDRKSKGSDHQVIPEIRKYWRLRSVHLGERRLCTLKFEPPTQNI